MNECTLIANENIAAALCVWFHSSLSVVRVWGVGWEVEGGAGGAGKTKIDEY